MREERLVNERLGRVLNRTILAQVALTGSGGASGRSAHWNHHLLPRSCRGFAVADAPRLAAVQRREIDRHALGREMRDQPQDLRDGILLRRRARRRARCGRPASIASIVRAQEFPGPTSMNARTPSRYAASITVGTSIVLSSPAVIESAHNSRSVGDSLLPHAPL